MNQCNGIANVGGQTVDCSVTITNTITGDPATSTQTVCIGGGACANNGAGNWTTSVTQCDGSGSGGGGTVNCHVTVNSVITGAPGTSSQSVTVNQCNGSGEGGGSTVACAPSGNTTSATVEQCNESGNGGGSVVRCNVTGTQQATFMPLVVDQCLGSGNGGGGTVTCSITFNTSYIAPSSSPTPTPTATITPTPGPTGGGSGGGSGGGGPPGDGGSTAGGGSSSGGSSRGGGSSGGSASTSGSGRSTTPAIVGPPRTGGYPDTGIPMSLPLTLLVGAIGTTLLRRPGSGARALLLSITIVASASILPGPSALASETPHPVAQLALPAPDPGATSDHAPVTVSAAVPRPLTPVGLDLRAPSVTVPLELLIPALDLRAPIAGVGITAKGTMDAPTGPRRDRVWQTAFWYRGGGIPGDIGTATIAGHSSGSRGRASIFARLSELWPGDVIIVRDTRRALTVRFIVTAAKSYSLEQAAQPEVLRRIYGAGPVSGRGPQPSDDGLSYLTLITCAGTFVGDTHDERLIVTAIRTGAA